MHLQAMTRLLHSPAGLTRSFQISNVNVFAFVEGGLDRSFFDRLLAKKCTEKNLKHQVISIKEIRKTGGKDALRAHFNQLRKSQNLLGEAWGKKLVYVFFADKDCDDFLRKRLRSKHFLYTPTYDIEAWLFRDGDLTQAIADACGLSREQSENLITHQDQWCRTIEESWEDWISLCLISQKLRCNVGCGYSINTSKINGSLTCPTDLTRHEEYVNRISRKLGSSEQDVRLFLDKTKHHVKAIRSKRGLFNYLISAEPQ